MDPILLVKLTAMLLWCHAAVLSMAWFRAVARTERRSHVGHFVSLMGELVPTSVGAVLLIFGGALLGMPSVVVFVAILIPAGLVLALVIEVDRIGETTYRAEAIRLALTLAMASGVFLLRGGV